MAAIRRPVIAPDAATAAAAVLLALLRRRLIVLLRVRRPVMMIMTAAAAEPSSSKASAPWGRRQAFVQSQLPVVALGDRRGRKESGLPPCQRLSGPSPNLELDGAGRHPLGNLVVQHPPLLSSQ